MVKMINVIVASSLFIMREGLKRIVASHKDISISAEVTSVEEIFMCGGTGRKEVAVIAHPLDYDGNDGFYFRLRKELSHLPIIVIVANNHLEHVSLAMKSGARGILSKHCSKEHLLEAIRIVSTGKFYVGKDISMLIVSRYKSFNAIHSDSSLTPRELQILKRIAIGRKMSTVALELGISVKTVSAHKANIMEKLALDSDSELVQYAIENKLFDLFVDHSSRKQQRKQQRA